MKTLTKTFLVNQSNTAKVLKSGDLDVLATPILVAWMENTAMDLAKDRLEDGDTTVGISISVQHTKASAIGETITCIATETKQDNRKLTFKIECKDSKGDVVGTSTHERFIVKRDRFMNKVYSKN